MIGVYDVISMSNCIKQLQGQVGNGHYIHTSYSSYAYLTVLSRMYFTRLLNLYLKKKIIPVILSEYHHLSGNPCWVFNHEFPQCKSPQDFYNPSWLKDHETYEVGVLIQFGTLIIFQNMHESGLKTLTFDVNAFSEQGQIYRGSLFHSPTIGVRDGVRVGLGVRVCA